MAKRTKIATFIRTVRAKKCQTQPEAAEKLGKNWNTVAKWEGGQVLPGMQSVGAIAKWAGVEVGEVLELIEASR